MSQQDYQLSYINTDGFEVRTAQFHRNRGTCCRSECLHCPFEYTQKFHSIEMIPIEEKHIKYANEIIRDSRPVERCSLSMSILAEGYGKKDVITPYHITIDNLQNFSFGHFKNHVCAVIEFSTKLSESTSGRSVKELFLKKEFKDQGLGVEHIGY